MAEVATYPLETIKLMQQVRGGSALSICFQILKTHGVRGFLHGATARITQTVATNVGFFIWQAILSQEDGSWVRKLMLNMLAQQINRILTMPRNRHI